MSAQQFFTTVDQYIENPIIFHDPTERKRMAKEQEEQENKQKLLDALLIIMNRVKIKVPNFIEKDLAKVDKNNLESEMQETMLRHSNVIDDIFQMTKVLIDMKAVKNSLTQLLHHKLKFKNQLLLKTAKEIQTYTDADPIFNQVNLQIKKVEAQIEKSKELSSDLRSKIGFIRDLTKLKTQELFGEKSG